MKKLILILPLLALSGCSHFAHKDIKSPCNSSKTAALGDNPCNPLPINIG